MTCTGAGNEKLLWTAGLIGSIDMEADNERATLQGVAMTNLRGMTIDAARAATCCLNGTVCDQPQRLVNWEAIELLQASRLTMNGNWMEGVFSSTTAY